ncbi:MAG: RNA-guided pseudouridylation complex pseudouridine synthase subunit Cbf5 [Candidatus Pacearchaeota archaeon]
MVDLNKIKHGKSVSELLEFCIINIDKPQKPTSFSVSDLVRKMLKELGVRKTSHFGTLDPKVTGVLPIAINRACKLTGFFIGEDKEYVGVMRVHEDLSIKEIQEKIDKKFLGKIKQTPPVKSRVKRQEREREIKSFKLIEKEGKDFLFHAEVQGGTYIRKLIDDLGKDLGVGAHMLELRRVRAGIFKEDDKIFPSVNLYDFEKAVEEAKKGNEELLREIVIPGEIVSQVYPLVFVKNEIVEKLLTGKVILKEYLKNEKEKFEKDSIVCVFNENKFIEMAKVMDEKYVFAKPLFVLN